MMTVTIDNPKMEERFGHSPQKVLDVLLATMDKQDEIAEQIRQIELGTQQVTPAKPIMDRLKAKYANQ